MARWLQDAETGEYFQEDELDPNSYNAVSDWQSYGTEGTARYIDAEPQVKRIRNFLEQKKIDPFSSMDLDQFDELLRLNDIGTMSSRDGFFPGRDYPKDISQETRFPVRREYTTAQYEYPSWLTDMPVVGSVPARALGSLGRMGAGLEAVLGDPFGTADEDRKRAQDLTDQARRDSGAEPGSFQDLAATAGGEVLASLPAMGGGLLYNAYRAATPTLSRAFGGRLLGQVSDKFGASLVPSVLPAADRYATYREQGVDRTSAGLAALGDLALNTRLNMFDIGQILSPQSLAKRIPKAAMVGAATNVGSGYYGAQLDRAVGLPQTPEQFAQNMAMQAVTGGLTTGGLSAVMPTSARGRGLPITDGGTVHPVEGMIDALSEGPAPVVPDAPVMPEPMPDASRLVSEAVPQPQDPNFFITNPEQLPVAVEPAGLPAGFPMNVPGPRSRWQPPPPEGFNRGNDFLFKDPAQPPILYQEPGLPSEFPLNIPGPRSRWQPPAPEGFNRGDDFLFKDPAQPPMVIPDSQAQPPAVIPDPVIDPAQYQGPQQGFALDAQPGNVREITAGVEPVEGYNGRSPYVTRRRAQDAQKVQADLELTRRRIVEQERVNRSNEPQRQVQPSRVIEGTTQAQSFDSPMARIQKAAEEAKTKEQPLIATPDNSPFTVRDAIKNVVDYIAKPKPSERGAIRNPFSKESKEIRDATTVDKRYSRWKANMPWSARNWFLTDSIGRDIPEVKPLVDSIDQVSEVGSKVLFDFEPDIMALYKVQGDPVVNGVIWKAEEKGSAFQLNPENLAKLGLTEDQVKGVLASKNMHLKTAEAARRHDFDMANRDYNVKVAEARMAAPLRAKDIEAQYRQQEAAILEAALDKTDPRVAVEIEKLKGEKDAKLVANDTWLTDTINRHATERYNLLKAIDDRNAAWIDSNYAPRNRYGQYKIKAFDAEGNLVDDRQTDSRSELAKMQKVYREKGFTTTIDVLKTRSSSERMNGISDEVASSMDPVGGHKKHLMPSRRIPGNDMDPVRAWAEYSRGFAKKVALDEMEMQWREGMLKIPRDPRDPRRIDINLDPVVTELQRRKDAVTETRSEVWKYISKVTDLSFLTFQLRSSMANTLVIFQRQYPELTKYGVQPEMTAAKSLGLNLKRVGMSDEAFAKSHPELAAAILEAQAKKIITPTAKSGSWWNRSRASFDKQVSRIADNKSKLLSTADDVAFFLQFHGDRFAEANGFITGWEAYPQAVKHFKKNNLEVPNRQQFAEQFAKDTKANIKTELLAPVMQGAGQSTFAKYKGWQLRYFGALADAAGKGNKGYLFRSIGATLAAAGVRGMPFYKTLIGVMGIFGVNPEDALQEYLEEKVPNAAEAIGSTAVYGPLSTVTGTNFSGAAGFGDPLPDFNRGFEAAIGSVIGGPLATIPRRAIDSFNFARTGQTGRALENLPVTVGLITDLAKAYRYNTEGVVTKGGIGILPKEEVTPAMIGRQLLGFGDMKTARAYDKYLAGERAGMDSEGFSYPALIAEAIVRGDTQREIALRQEADQSGKLLKERDIQEKVQKRLGNESAILKKYPKATREEAAKARSRY